MLNAVKVKLWDELVGILTWDNQTHNTYFYFNPEYRKTGLKPFPLNINERILKGDFPAYGNIDNPVYQKLPFFLSGCLPDDWGNELFDKWRILQRLSVSQITPLSKLSFIGKRGMGALEFEPQTSLKITDVALDVQSLVDLAKKIYEDRRTFVLTEKNELVMQNLIAVGTSAGGRQAKAIIAIDRETKEIRTGQIAGQSRSDYFLLKFGHHNRNTSEIEMCYYELACMSGIEMMQSKLIKVGNENHFMTKRFDRTENGEKIHMLTLAALDPTADSYEKLMLTCRKLGLSYREQEQIFRRMVFNVLGNNTDDHSRNFSFLMDRTGKWTLSPAYDMTYIFHERGGYLPKDERCMMINGKKKDICLEDLLHFASHNDIQNPKEIICQVANSLAQFKRVSKKYGVEEEWSGRIYSLLIRNFMNFGLMHKRHDLNSYQTQDGQSVAKIYIEPAQNGTYHLTATVDNTPRKFIIGPKKPGYNIIRDYGECVYLIPFDWLKKLVEIYLLKSDIDLTVSVSPYLQIPVEEDVIQNLKFKR